MNHRIATAASAAVLAVGLAACAGQDRRAGTDYPRDYTSPRVGDYDRSGPQPRVGSVAGEGARVYNYPTESGRNPVVNPEPMNRLPQVPSGSSPNNPPPKSARGLDDTPQ